MILQSENVTEIEQIRSVVPEIAKFADDLKKLRQMQKQIFSKQFQRFSLNDDNYITLPALPNRSSQFSDIKTRDSHMTNHVASDGYQLNTIVSPRGQLHQTAQ